MNKWSILAILWLCVACNSTNKPVSQQRDSVKKTDSSTVEKDSVIIPKTYPAPDFEKVEAKCKYINPKKLDPRKDFEWHFKILKPLTHEDFYSLQINTFNKHFEQKSLAQEIDYYFHYYSFHENLNGNRAVVIVQCCGDATASFICCVYDKKGKLLDHKSIAHAGGDADMHWWQTGEFKNNHVFEVERKFFVNGNELCTWYKMKYVFSKEGKITAQDTVFYKKPVPYRCA